MISGELEIVLLIFCLYGSTCVSFAYANEGILQRVFGGMRLRVAGDHIRIAGRSPMCVNPFTPMFPVFRGHWGDAATIAASPGLPSRVVEVLSACDVLAPYVLVVAIYTIIGIPAALLLGSVVAALPVVALAYLATIVLLVRLWFLRDCFSLSGAKFALLALESIACLPFSAGIVRRLSLMTPIREDLASYLTDMPVESRISAAEVLVHRSDELAGFYPSESPEHVRLSRYRDQLALQARASSAPYLEADATRANETDCATHGDDSPTLRV